MPGAMDARCWSRPAPIGCLIGWLTSTCMRQGCSIMPPDNEKARLDDAARAGWLYFIAGRTQDEIARLLKVSRATAQRLVSLCLSQKLITFRLEHSITGCMELAARLTDKFNLRICEVTPTDPVSPVAVAGIAERAANLLESALRDDKPAII